MNHADGTLIDVLQFLFMGIQRGSIYAMVAMGFNMIYNSTGIINFAQGEFVVLGGLMMVTLTMAFNLSIVFAFLLTALFVVIAGVLMERLTINPVREPTVLRLIIITIAVSIIIKGAAMCFWGKGHRFETESGLLPPSRRHVTRSACIPPVLPFNNIFSISGYIQWQSGLYTSKGPTTSPPCRLAAVMS